MCFGRAMSKMSIQFTDQYVQLKHAKLPVWKRVEEGCNRPSLFWTIHGEPEPQSIPPFLFTWGKLPDLINQDQSFPRWCVVVSALSRLCSSHCMLTNMGVIRWQVKRGCKWDPLWSLPLGLAYRQTHNVLLWNGYLCLDISVFDSTRAMFWTLFLLFCWQNFTEVKRKEYTVHNGCAVE